MDDLRAALGAFDPDAPLAPAPDPWHEMPMPVVRGGPPWAMAEMIAAEPAVAARIVARLTADGSAGVLAETVVEAAKAGRPVVLTGCGTSEHAALGAAEVLREAWRSAGLRGSGPTAAQAFELSLDPPRDSLVIGVSHEGGTAATIAAMEAARAAGSRVALLTASAGSPAAHAADVVLATLEMDRSWCHTMGYVSPIVAAITVADLLAGRTPEPAAIAGRLRSGIEAAHGAPAAGMPGVVDDGPPDAGIARVVGAASHLIVIASGADRTAARELVLKVEEASWMPSASRDLETFLHGHLPATDENTALVLVLTERAAARERARRARQALAAAIEVGIRPGAILGEQASASIPDRLTPAGRIVVPEAPAMAGPAASLLGTAGPLQLLTLEISSARGTNPDPIRRDDPRYRRAADAADAPDA